MFCELIKMDYTKSLRESRLTWTTIISLSLCSAVYYCGIIPHIYRSLWSVSCCGGDIQRSMYAWIRSSFSAYFRRRGAGWTPATICAYRRFRCQPADSRGGWWLHSTPGLTCPQHGSTYCSTILWRCYCVSFLAAFWTFHIRFGTAELCSHWHSKYILYWRRLRA